MWIALISTMIMLTVLSTLPSLLPQVSVISLFQMITMCLNGFGVYLPQLQGWIAWAPYLDFARYGENKILIL